MIPDTPEEPSVVPASDTKISNDAAPASEDVRVKDSRPGISASPPTPAEISVPSRVRFHIFNFLLILFRFK